MNTCEKTNLGRESQTDGDGARDGGFSGSVRANDHVERRSGTELDMVVRQERLTGDANDGSRDITEGGRIRSERCDAHGLDASCEG